MGISHEGRVRTMMIFTFVASLADSLISVEGVAEMAALGMGLERGTFKQAGQYGYVNQIPSFFCRFRQFGPDRIS